MSAKVIGEGGTSPNSGSSETLTNLPFFPPA
eukprot:CAMPEP_0176174418 /NCGR_PEP_ID=MMETSP0120_2-20121206/89360_1 /TAXON_ID=160619 /ORGANISM="Kryptoperidinium foliaceum, Strain CCMP 1326" /LENGTH=30 /DNA_ID= /DNA_START= /DNA_END= /DNA_ORIENTATION=